MPGRGLRLQPVPRRPWRVARQGAGTKWRRRPCFYMSRQRPLRRLAAPWRSLRPARHRLWMTTRQPLSVERRSSAAVASRAWGAAEGDTPPKQHTGQHSRCGRPPAGGARWPRGERWLGGGRRPVVRRDSGKLGGNTCRRPPPHRRRRVVGGRRRGGRHCSLVGKGRADGGGLIPYLPLCRGGRRRGRICGGGGGGRGCGVGEEPSPPLPVRPPPPTQPLRRLLRGPLMWQEPLAHPSLK